MFFFFSSCSVCLQVLYVRAGMCVAVIACGRSQQAWQWLFLETLVIRVAVQKETEKCSEKNRSRRKNEGLV